MFQNLHLKGLKDICYPSMFNIHLRKKQCIQPDKQYTNSDGFETSNHQIRCSYSDKRVFLKGKKCIYLSVGPWNICIILMLSWFLQFFGYAFAVVIVIVVIWFTFLHFQSKFYFAPLRNLTNKNNICIIVTLQFSGHI